MGKGSYDIVVRFLDFYDAHERLARGVIARLLGAGFSYALKKRTGKETDIQTLMLEDFRRHRARVLRACVDHSVDKGGWIAIRHRGVDLLRVYYESDGTVRYHFGGDEPAPAALARNMDLFLGVRRELAGLVDEQFLSDAVTLICRFFRSVPPGGYRLVGFLGSERVTEGAWTGKGLEVQVLHLGWFFDFAQVALHGLDFQKARMRNAVDAMRFYATMQRALAHLAGVLTVEGYRLEIFADGRPIFRTGKGVRPAPSDAYGNTEIRVDHTLAALAAERGLA